MLPVTLPEMTDFAARPADGQAGDPVPPLARARDWADVELDLGDGPRTYRRELNTMPQWAGSCWYYLRYLNPDNDAAFVGREAERYWMVPAGGGADDVQPGDGGGALYGGGVEHSGLPLLYARIWPKVMLDPRKLSTRGPFRRPVYPGLITDAPFPAALR